MSQTQTGGVILVVCLLFAVITAGQEISNDPAEVHCPAVWALESIQILLSVTS